MCKGGIIPSKKNCSLYIIQKFNALRGFAPPAAWASPHYDDDVLPAT